MFPIPSSGGAQFFEKSLKIIRLVKHGCTNRPFFHVVVMEKFREQYEPVIEQVGTYDPLPNKYNEKLVALNFERIKYWIGSGAAVSFPVTELLGICGFYPVHPRTYMDAWRRRESLLKELESLEKEDTSKVS